MMCVLQLCQKKTILTPSKVRLFWTCVPLLLLTKLIFYLLESFNYFSFWDSSPMHNYFIALLFKTKPSSNNYYDLTPTEQSISIHSSLCSTAQFFVFSASASLGSITTSFLVFAAILNCK